jgi:sugar (pentulose or hexulose) kinase
MATQEEKQPSILAVDCGTTGLKATLVAKDGRTLATAMHDYRNKTRSSAGGFVEQLPDDWWCASRQK